MTISNVTWSPNTPTEKDSNVDTACMDTGRELQVFYGRKEAKALRIKIDQLARYRGKEDQILTITSSGGSAESIWSGNCLGQFVYNGEHKGAASYKQRNTIDTNTRFLYRLGDSTWAVGPELGGDKCYLRSSSTSSSVPSDNWQYYDSDDKWKSDPGVRIVRGPLTSCQTISVEVRGAAATAQSDCAGDYRVTADWSYGHQVFKHSCRELYLCVGVWNGSRVCWYITNKVKGGTSFIWSRATAWCPADRRATTTQGHTWSWGYRDSGNWRNGDIRIKCNVYDVDNSNKSKIL